MNIQLWGQGVIYFLLGALGPLQALYSTNAELTSRNIIAAGIGGLISGLAAVKAFMSTTYSDSGAGDAAPKKVEIDQPITNPIPTVETTPLSPAEEVAELTQRQKKKTNLETRKPERGKGRITGLWLFSPFWFSGFQIISLFLLASCTPEQVAATSAAVHQGVRDYKTMHQIHKPNDDQPRNYSQDSGSGPLPKDWNGDLPPDYGAPKPKK